MENHRPQTKYEKTNRSIIQNILVEGASAIKCNKAVEKTKKIVQHNRIYSVAHYP